MLGGRSRSTTNIDGSESNYQQAANEGINLAGISTGRSSTIRATDQSNNTGMILSGNIGGGRGSTTSVTLTDHGAIQSAVALGAHAISEMGDFGSEAFFFADRAADRSAMLVGDAMDGMARMSERQAAASRDTVSEIGRLAETFRSDGASSTQRNMMYIGGGLILLGVVGIVVMGRGKK